MAIPRTILRGWNILVVDDEPDCLEVAMLVLRHYGASVVTASDGQEALAFVSARQPDLIISDLSMPVLDGWSFIEKLKQNRATMDIPVVALTAHAMPGDRERAMGSGFLNYLTKPLTATSFIIDLLNLLIEIPEFSDSLKEYISD